MSDRLPFMKFFPMDFDIDMAPHSLEIRGAWITIINHLWNCQPRGEATHSHEQWGRILGTVENDTERIINYIINEKIASCNGNCNGIVTLMSRRIQREEKDRESVRIRVQRHREKIDCNADVTPLCNGLVTVQKLEVRSKKLEVIKEKDLKEVLLEHEKTFSEAYPGINLKTETAKAQAWIESNPKNKKSNLKRFLNNWLLKAQDQVNKYPPKEDKFL